MPEPTTVIAVGTGVMGLGAHLAKRYFDAAKEVIDIVLGAMAFVLTLPLLVFCMVLVKFSSRGPIFYTQVRVGKDGREFTMYKFRTMRSDAEALSGAKWAEQDDPRIVKSCRWMRISHVDELPQILNVIRGEMSLVGPRPERLEILEKLEKTYPNVRKRLAVRPGITGLAQVRNGYDATVEGFGAKLESDLEYIENRGWRNELRILLATFGKVYDKQAN